MIGKVETVNGVKKITALDNEVVANMDVATPNDSVLKYNANTGTVEGAGFTASNVVKKSDVSISVVAGDTLPPSGNAVNTAINTASNALNNNIVTSRESINLKRGTFGVLGGCTIAASHTVDDLLNIELASKNGAVCEGSVDIQTSTLDVPVTWYHFIYIPHGPDTNCATLLLFPFWRDDIFYRVRRYYDNSIQGPVNAPAKAFANYDLICGNMDAAINRAISSFNTYFVDLRSTIANVHQGTWERCSVDISGKTATLTIIITNPNFFSPAGDTASYLLCTLPVGYRPYNHTYCSVHFNKTPTIYLGSVNNDGGVYIYGLDYGTEINSTVTAIYISVTYQLA